MDEQQARLRVEAASDGSFAHYDAGGSGGEQQAANDRLADALADYRQALAETEKPPSH